MRTLAYIRQLVHEHNQPLQTQSIQQYRPNSLFMEIDHTKSPELNKLLATIKKGDTLVIYRLDVLGKNLDHLIEILSSLDKNGVNLISIQEGINTQLPSGSGFYRYIGNLSHFCTLKSLEKKAIEEINGMEQTKAGRPDKLEAKQMQLLRTLIEDKNHTIDEMCEILKITKPTFYRYKEMIK